MSDQPMTDAEYCAWVRRSTGVNPGPPKMLRVLELASRGERIPFRVVIGSAAETVPATPETAQ